ncbi:DUF6518 family protein [Dactylosporangium sp. NBC_01737]|uniref:DUF6518 family protein n=1 Tax=Dactylosporangium sp. NBC_01737 TaxID=2975959 RepID=UPI002E13C931|nr:DUF6518 family protein [Dactylosporangium sp. NBC_01737]
MLELDRGLPPRGVRLGWAAAAGVGLGAGLGAASFCADRIDGMPRLLLQFVASTGFAWGCAAFIAAFPARTRAGAVTAAVAVLCTATVCYYALNVRGDALVPVLLALAYWLLPSVAGGAALGVLAHMVRTDRPPSAAVAAGLACGLLAGAGADIVIALLAAGDHGPARLADGILQVVASVAVTTWLFGRRRGPQPWLRFAATAVAACAASTLAWSAVESVQVIGF